MASDTFSILFAILDVSLAPLFHVSLCFLEAIPSSISSTSGSASEHVLCAQKKHCKKSLNSSRRPKELPHVHKKVALRKCVHHGTDGACPPTALLQCLNISCTECSRIKIDIKLIALAIIRQLE